MLVGWLVAWSDDPEEMPVEVYDRGPVLLTVGGEYGRIGGDVRRAPAAPGRLRARW